MTYTVYALYNPDGELIKCSKTLKEATNYLTLEMNVDFWNSLFGSSPTVRVKVFKQYGWSVKIVELIPVSDL